MRSELDIGKNIGSSVPWSFKVGGVRPVSGMILMILPSSRLKEIVYMLDLHCIMGQYMSTTTKNCFLSLFLLLFFVLFVYFSVHFQHWSVDARQGQ